MLQPTQTIGAGQIVRTVFAAPSSLSSAQLVTLPVQPTPLPTGAAGGSPNFAPQLFELARLSSSQSPLQMRHAASPFSVTPLPLQRSPLLLASARPASLIPTVSIGNYFQLPLQFSPPNKQPLPQQQLRQLPAPFPAQFPGAPGPLMGPAPTATVIMPTSHHLVAARPSIAPQLVLANAPTQ